MLIAVDRKRREDGFTVIEVLVALTLFALVAAAIVPLLAIAGSAAVSTRSHTRAKNLAQERMEQMRQLPFQVDVQNGPFVDLLDYYYPNLTTSTTALSTGQWVSSASTARQAGEPTAGSFYRTTFATLAGQPGFSQTVAVQFLDFSRNPVPDTRFSTYRHDVEGLDGSPSTLLGVTVITRWTHGGKAQSFRTFTQIGDTGDTDGLLISQASAVMLRLESALSGGTSITSELLSVTADGRLSDGSVATALATGGRATRTGATDVVSANAVAVDPPNCSGATCPANTLTSGPQPGGSCDYASFGRTRVGGVTATTADGLPRVPADAGSSVPAANSVYADLLKESGSTCGAVTFDNTGGAGAPALGLAAGARVVTVEGDTTSSGSTPIATSKAWVTSTAVDASPRRVAAGASIATEKNVRLFPSSDAPTGVLKITLKSASITCDSSAAAPVASYKITASYWNDMHGYVEPASGEIPVQPPGAYVDLVTGSTTLTEISWSSGTAFTDPFLGVVLSDRIVHKDVLTGVTRTLADLLDGAPRLATAVTADSTNGLASIGDGVVGITTQPLRTGDPLSSVGVKLGKLSCVAVDQR